MAAAMSEPEKPADQKSPAKKPKSREERRAAIERWRKLSKGLSLGGLKIRDLINEGCR